MRRRLRTFDASSVSQIQRLVIYMIGTIYEHAAKAAQDFVWTQA
jgi:hypothetical protein